MINHVKICENGNVIPQSDNLGRTGEKNSTVLSVEFFETLNGKSVSDFEKNLVAVFSQGVMQFEIGDEFLLPAELTAETELVLLFQLEQDDNVVFKSCPHTFNLTPSGDTPEVDVIGAAVKSAQDRLRTELAEVVSFATGEENSDKTWPELKETVADLSVQSFIEPMFEFFEDYFGEYETPEDPGGGGTIPVEPEIPIEPEGDDENVTE